MSSGTTIIASNLPVLKEVLKDKKNCLLASPFDHLEWIKAINELKTNKILRKKIINNALYDIKQNFTWDIRADNIIKYLFSPKQPKLK